MRLEYATILSVFCLLVPGLCQAATYYAAPQKQGSGDGSSQANAFQIADFWGVAQPGDTLNIMDGEYKGSNLVYYTTPLVGTEDKPMLLMKIRCFSTGKEWPGPFISLTRNTLLLRESMHTAAMRKHSGFLGLTTPL
jgi:hypothetical protein